MGTSIEKGRMLREHGWAPTFNACSIDKRRHGVRFAVLAVDRPASFELALCVHVHTSRMAAYALSKPGATIGGTEYSVVAELSMEDLAADTVSVLSVESADVVSGPDVARLATSIGARERLARKLSAQLRRERYPGIGAMAQGVGAILAGHVMQEIASRASAKMRVSERYPLWALDKDVEASARTADGLASLGFGATSIGFCVLDPDGRPVRMSEGDGLDGLVLPSLRDAVDAVAGHDLATNLVSFAAVSLGPQGARCLDTSGGRALPEPSDYAASAAPRVR